MKWMAKWMGAACAVAVMTTAAMAAERASKDEAVAFSGRAVAFWKKNGKDKAIAEFNDKKGQFIDRDLYVFVLDANGKALAHGANPKLVGRDLTGLKDPDGKPFVKEMLSVGAAGKPGWVDYKWPNPVTQAVEAKTSYVVKVDDAVMGVGVYK